MKRSLNFRETLAWIVLACAAFLFSITIAFAQEKSTPKKSSTTIKIIKKEDGKTTKIDTTIDSADRDAIERIFESLGLENDAHFNFSFPEPPDTPGKHRKMKFQYKGMSEKEHEELNKEMEKLHEEMGDLHEKLRDIHIEISSGDDGEEGREFSYNFVMPPIPPCTPSPGEEPFEFDHHFIKRSHVFHSSEIPDSLQDEDHIVLRGDDSELPPVFEKAITGKNGEKFFIYKRNGNERKSAEKEKEITGKYGHVKVYPNPTNGKFKVDVNSDRKSAITIKIFDRQGKEVYSELIDDFDGSFSGEIDLGNKGKGTYIVKVNQGTITWSEKLVIE